jgi:phosphatidylserine decarboxylase
LTRVIRPGHESDKEPSFRAKYEPYDALRQRFWRQYLLQFDSDNTGSISFTELTTMLDSLNSTLTNSTLEGYFTRFGKDPEQDELSFDEIIRCLEDEIKKSAAEKKHLRSEPPSGATSPSAYPPMAPYPASDGLDESGPSARAPSGVDADELAAHIKASRPTRDNDDSPNGDVNVKPIQVERSGGVDAGQHLQAHDALSPGSTPDVSDSESDIGVRGETERVVNIKSCPLCHRPRLKKKSEADILTHLAVCASADWDRVDRIVVGNYVTASQAQRKFFSKVLTKVSAGAYSLGANSANIIVQDRLTGQLQEEKMAVYVRIGIRVLYKGAKKGMQGDRGQLICIKAFGHWLRF